jgi:hypothetical protein
VVGRPDDAEPLPPLFPHLIFPGYLEAMETRVVEGRALSTDDGTDAPPVILINETGARRAFQGQDALGQHLRLWNEVEYEVVGVVQDTRHLSPEMDPGIEVYFPLTQMPDFNTLDLVVRSRLPTAQTVSTVSAVLHDVDPAMPTGEFWTMESSVDRAVSARSFTLWILTIYGGTALLLAALGIYGVLAQSVAERSQEIGIRMALGASWLAVVRNVLGRTLILTGVGIVVGGLASIWAGRVVGTLLFGVGAVDPFTYGGMAAVLLAVAVLAGLVPALRAGRIRGTKALEAI